MKKSHDAGANIPLSRERVLQQALKVADTEGMDALSMRRLAKDLGAGAMSLYHHVRDKEDLLDGMVDLVFAEIIVPDIRADWQSSMKQRAISIRDVLERHPWAIPLMESRTTPGPSNLKHRDAVVGSLRGAGFTLRMATHANWLLDSYIYGFALQEANLPFTDADQLADLTEDVFLPQLDPSTYPHLHAAASEMMQMDYNPADEFEHGLNLILDALERDRISSFA